MPKQKEQNHESPLENMIPCNLNIEKAVLCVLMSKKDAYDQVSNIIIPDDFYNSEHKQIFGAIKELYENDKPVDILTVLEVLKKGTQSDMWINMLANIINLFTPEAHVEYHARILHQLGIKRRLIQLAATVHSKAIDPTSDVDETAEFLLSEYCNIFDVKEPYGIDSLVMKACKSIQDAASINSGVTGVPSGINKIDRVTSGFHTGDVVLIGGRPSMGKTTFVVSILKNIAFDNKIPTAFFSLEMSGKQVSDRLISNICSIPGDKILSGQLTPDEWGRFEASANIFAKAPLYVDDTPYLDISKFRLKLLRLIKERGVKIAFIDYIQLLKLGGAYWGAATDLSIVMRQIKSLARELNIPIVITSQLHRADSENSYRKYGDEPHTTDFVGYNEMSMYADTVMLLHRPEYYHIYEDENGNSTRGLLLVKLYGKHHAKTRVNLGFSGEYCRITDDYDNTNLGIGDGKFMSSSLLSGDDPLADMMPPNDAPY